MWVALPRGMLEIWCVILLQGLHKDRHPCDFQTRLLFHGNVKNLPNSVKKVENRNLSPETLPEQTDATFDSAPFPEAKLWRKKANLVFPSYSDNTDNVNTMCLQILVECSLAGSTEAD